MTNLLDKFTTAEKKEILNAGEKHPRYAELMRAYRQHARREANRIRENY